MPESGFSSGWTVSAGGTVSSGRSVPPAAAGGVCAERSVSAAGVSAGSGVTSASGSSAPSAGLSGCLPRPIVTRTGPVPVLAKPLPLSIAGSAISASEQSTIPQIVEITARRTARCLRLVLSRLLMGYASLSFSTLIQTPRPGEKLYPAKKFFIYL